MIDPHTGLIIGAVAAKGGVLTYHYDPAADRNIRCWLNARR